LTGKALHCPVFYSGSIERTAFAERLERKGCMILELHGECASDLRWRFCELPARPMRIITVDAGVMDIEQMTAHIRAALSAMETDSIVQVHLEGADGEDAMRFISRVRSQIDIPPEMSFEWRPR
jgi:DNA repair exonuclease SbcCD nuclease subunit